MTAWQPNYSFNIPGTPHYAAAQGSLIVIYGERLGPNELRSQGFNPALDRNFGGVSIQIRVGSTTTEAIPYYVSAQQIAAILPSTTPTGDGALSVTYNGGTSAAVPIRVVQSAVGLLTINGTGSGPAAVYDSSNRLITRINAANAGDTIVFWGTGVGPDLVDETRLITTPHNLNNVPFEFYIGGKPATVTYRGRSTYPGVDQMNVVVPSDTEGCAVTAYAKTGAYISNIVTIPVAASGKVCSDVSGFPADQISRLDARSRAILGGFVSLGKTANWQGDFYMTPEPGTIYDEADLEFQQFSTLGFDWLTPSELQPPSIGSCVAKASDGRRQFVVQPFILLNGVTLKFPDGTSRAMAGFNHPTYYKFGPSGSEPFIPNTGGLFQAAAGGNATISPFGVDLPAVPALHWTNKAQLADIPVTRPLELTWTGVPGTYAVISGLSNTADLSSLFYCTAPGDAGRFTVPADILSHMLKTVSTNDAGEPVQSGRLTLTLYRNPTFQNVQGLDFVKSSTYSSELFRVNFK